MTRQLTLYLRPNALPAVCLPASVAQRVERSVPNSADCLQVGSGGSVHSCGHPCGQACCQRSADVWVSWLSPSIDSSPALSTDTSPDGCSPFQGCNTVQEVPEKQCCKMAGGHRCPSLPGWLSVPCPCDDSAFLVALPRLYRAHWVCWSCASKSQTMPRNRRRCKTCELPVLWRCLTGKRGNLTPGSMCECLAPFSFSATIRHTFRCCTTPGQYAREKRSQNMLVPPPWKVNRRFDNRKEGIA